jgi:hypothetical protein
MPAQLPLLDHAGLSSGCDPEKPASEGPIIEARKEVAAGAQAADKCRRLERDEQAFDRWKSKLGDMDMRDDCLRAVRSK